MAEEAGRTIKKTTSAEEADTLNSAQVEDGLRPTNGRIKETTRDGRIRLQGPITPTTAGVEEEEEEGLRVVPDTTGGTEEGVTEGPQVQAEMTGLRIGPLPSEETSVSRQSSLAEVTDLQASTLTDMRIFPWKLLETTYLRESRT